MTDPVQPPADRPPGSPLDAGDSPRHRLLARFHAGFRDTDGSDIAAPEMLPVCLARACASVLEVDDAGLSVMDGDFRVPLGASSETATLAERLQFTQGQGPCLAAAQAGRIVAADADQLSRQWPSFADELFGATPYRAIITIPLAVAISTKGAIDLYLTDPRRLRSVPLADAAIIADAVTDALRVSDDSSAEDDEVEGSAAPIPSWLTGPTAQHRRYVWLAVGMMIARFETNPADALALLRSHAYSHDTVLDQVAADIVAGRVSIDQLQD